MSEWVWERHAAGSMGLSVEEAREARKRVLVEGSDWRKGSLGRIEWSEAGRGKVERVLGVVKSEECGVKSEEALLDAGGGPGAEGEGADRMSALQEVVERVFVVVGRVPNRRLVLCARAHGERDRGKWFRVRVADNGNFVAGMEVLAGRATGRPETDVWVFKGNPKRPGVGPRCPRALGRW